MPVKHCAQVHTREPVRPDLALGLGRCLCGERKFGDCTNCPERQPAKAVTGGWEQRKAEGELERLDCWAKSFTGWSEEEDMEVCNLALGRRTHADRRWRIQEKPGGAGKLE
jgi:hypothetical protein